MCIRDSAQAAIEAMIPANNVDANKLGAAQAKAAGQVNNFVTMTNPQTVNAAGVYLIKATEEGYTYNPVSYTHLDVYKRQEQKSAFN